MRTRGSLVAAAGALLLMGPGGASGQAPEGAFRVRAEDVPAEAAARVREDLVWTEARIGRWLGPFPDTVLVRVLPGRAAFDAALREAWAIPETACWMVGAADDHSLYLLSPAVWRAEACEHDGDDGGHRRRLITHEAVHAYHGQVNPSPDVGLLEDVGWFVEGLATYVSGQLAAEHAGRAAEAVAAGRAPVRLTEAWSGPYRYGVAGSLAAFIDRRWGRAALRRAMTATTQAGLLAPLGLDEDGFLAEWRAWVAVDAM